MSEKSKPKEIKHKKKRESDINAEGGSTLCVTTPVFGILSESIEDKNVGTKKNLEKERDKKTKTTEIHSSMASGGRKRLLTRDESTATNGNY